MEDFFVGRGRIEVDGRYQCKGCGLMLEAGEFYVKRVRGADYLGSKCKECEYRARKVARPQVESRKRLRIPVEGRWVEREGKMRRVVAIVEELEKME